MRRRFAIVAVPGCKFESALRAQLRLYQCMSDVAASDFPVGCTVSVVAQGEQVQGEVFAFDSASDTVLIHQQGSTPFHSNLRLLKVAYLKVALWSSHSIPSS